MNADDLSLAVLIPAYNEADVIADTIAAAKEIPHASQIIVIDDGSVDDTGKKAAMAGAKVIRFKHNMGKGAALREGYAYVDQADIVLFLDADTGNTAKQASLLIQPLLEDQADVTIARFVYAEEYKMHGGFGIVKVIARWGIKMLTGQRLESVLSGQRAFKKAVLDNIGIRYNGYGIELGMSADILRAGYRVMEVDVAMVHRYSGRDVKGFIHRFHQFIDILMTILAVSLSKRRSAWYI
jgi:glycosyltransferase involved in cell wall biosynthesis